LFESFQPKVIVCLVFGGLSILLAIVLAQAAVPLNKKCFSSSFHLAADVALFSLARAFR
jgi:hypothetical protein